jgi:uncharacterized hydrophobic protein (TIGR00271 family)
MTVALILLPGQNAQPLVPWATHLAQLRQQDLLLICPLRREPPLEAKEVADVEACPSELVPFLEAFGQVGWKLSSAPGEEVEASAEVAEGPTNRLRLALGPAGQWAPWVLAKLKSSGVQLLILPRDAETRARSAGLEEHRQILAEAPCEVLQIRTGQVDAESCQKIMVAAGPGVSASIAIRWAADLAESLNAELTGLYVEPDVDPYAHQVGQQILDRHLRQSIGSRADSVQRRVVLGSDIVPAIVAVMDDYDLVVLAAGHHGRVHRWLFRGLTEELIGRSSQPTIVSIRMGMPLVSRVLRAVENALRNSVPQLEREGRVDLVERIQASSRWDFDFVALICLSTLIATGGLMEGSTAVVIGAMLVAPLMTPLLGAGLSLVQGNRVLLRHALVAVFRGFLLALALAFTVGCLERWRVGSEHLPLRVTAEMAARGAPGVLDLAVAFISGVAAAYAIGRPKLLSALPGVAIAAALVPPIATLGLGLAWGEYWLAVGAGVLFLTNIVAIVLGTACSFWSVGIRGAPSQGVLGTPTRRTALALVALLLGLGIYEVLPGPRVPPQLDDELRRFLKKVEDEHHLQLRVLAIGFATRGADRLVVELASDQPLPKQVTTELDEIVRRHRERLASVDVELRMHLGRILGEAQPSPTE